MPDHALHPVHRFVLAQPDGAAAVGVLFDRVLDRHEGGGTVVLRPVELHAAGDPRAQQTDQRRLDDVLAVEEVVAVRLVQADVDAAADLRQDHQPDVFVLEVDCLVWLVELLVANPVGEGIRIHLAAAALIDPLVEEHRIAVRRAPE